MSLGKMAMELSTCPVAVFWAFLVDYRTAGGKTTMAVAGISVIVVLRILSVIVGYKYPTNEGGKRIFQ